MRFADIAPGARNVRLPRFNSHKQTNRIVGTTPQPHSRNRQSTLPPDGPIDAVAAHDSGHLLVQMPLQRRPPGNKCEFPALFDQRIASRCQLERTPEHPLDPLAVSDFGLGESGRAWCRGSVCEAGWVWVVPEI